VSQGPAAQAIRLIGHQVLKRWKSGAASQAGGLVQLTVSPEDWE
jgi:hypothetical protein